MGSQLLLNVLRDEPILKNVDFQSVADTGWGGKGARATPIYKHIKLLSPGV